MADKAISELIAANQVTPTDLFVLEQSGTAKKLTGQTLENWLVSFADGHGGIQSIAKVGTNELVDTYRITLADTTTFDFLVSNGKGINSITKTGTSGLVDTYTIQYNDNTTSTFTVTNGAKGDKGDNQYVWIKYASQKPTASSHSFGDVADNWIGIYSGDSTTAPTDWTQYEWFEIKGEKGDTGNPATLTSSVVEYQVSDSGTIIPSGVWSEAVPVVAQGRYLWTRTTNTFNTGSPVVAYSVSRMGLDGSGSVSSVAGVSPDPDGNVPLTAESVGALPSAGGEMTGELRMNGQPISGLNAPTTNDQAANMGFVNQQVKKAAPRNLLDNSDFRNPVNQRGLTTASALNIEYFVDRWLGYGAGASYDVSAKKLAITNDGSATCGFIQRVSVDALTAGKTYTFAIKATVTGAWYLSYGNSATSNTASSAMLDGGIEKVHVFSFVLPESTADVYNFRIRSSATVGSAVIEWAALYEGEYTTETLPEYQPKGYGAELAECQRYYIHNVSNATGLATSSTAYLFLPLPVCMRVIPSLDNLSIGSIRAGGQSVTPTAVTVAGAKGNVLSVNATYASNNNIANHTATWNGSCNLSADL